MEAFLTGLVQGIGFVFGVGIGSMLMLVLLGCVGGFCYARKKRKSGV
jgi:hypothetical protein